MSKQKLTKLGILQETLAYLQQLQEQTTKLSMENQCLRQYSRARI